MAKKLIYYDNCTDSFPKAPNIYKKSAKFMENFGIYPYSGNSDIHKEAEEIIRKSKIKLSNIFNISNPNNIYFSSSNNEIISFLLKTSLKKGDHIIVTNFENDFFLKTLKLLEKQGIQISFIKADKFGNIDPLHFLWAIRESTKLIYCSHVSAFNSSLLPVKELGSIAKKHNIPFALDVSQSSGLVDIDIEELHVSYLICNLNIHLLSPQGLAFLFINKEFLNEIPKFYKEINLFSDINNLNLYGISALYYSLEYYEERERKRDFEKLIELKNYILKEMGKISEIKLYISNKEFFPEISFSLEGDSKKIKEFLLTNYNIVLCDCDKNYSLAYEAFGIKNAFKISLGLFNSSDECKILIKAIKQFLKN